MQDLLKMVLHASEAFLHILYHRDSRCAVRLE